MALNDETRGERLGRRLRTIPAVVAGFLLVTALLPLLLVAMLAYDTVRALRGRGRFSAVRLLLFGWVYLFVEMVRDHCDAGVLAGQRVRPGAPARTWR